MTVHRAQFPAVRRGTWAAELRLYVACWLVVAAVVVFDVAVYGGIWLLIRAAI